MFKNILIALALIVIAFVGYVASRPADYAVERSLTMDAPPAVVFAQLNDFHEWDAWSPWNDVDPDMVKTITGSETGVGAEYHWVGNDQAGEGHMTITESRPHERLSIDLDFLKPFAASSIIVFDLTPAGDGTEVTWTMSGKNNFVAKAVGLFMDMDASIGGDFEKGLKSMKEVSEAAAADMPMEGAEEAEGQAASS